MTRPGSPNPGQAVVEGPCARAPLGQRAVFSTSGADLASTMLHIPYPLPRGALPAGVAPPRPRVRDVGVRRVGVGGHVVDGTVLGGHDTPIHAVGTVVGAASGFEHLTLNHATAVSASPAAAVGRAMFVRGISGDA